MKYGRLVLAIAGFSLTACVAQKQSSVLGSATSSHAQGTFKKDVYLSPGAENVYLTIDADSVTSFTECKYVDEKVKVVVHSPAQVSEGHINVLTGGSKTKMIQGTPCLATLESGVMAYEVINNQLWLTRAGGKTTFYGYRVGKEPTLKDHLENLDQAVFGAAKATASGVKSGAKWYGKQLVESINQNDIN